LFNNVFKEKLFTIEIEDLRKAPIPIFWFKGSKGTNVIGTWFS